MCVYVYLFYQDPLSERQSYSHGTSRFSGFFLNSDKHQINVLKKKSVSHNYENVTLSTNFTQNLLFVSSYYGQHFENTRNLSALCWCLKIVCTLHIN